jgi:hypothetical protein
MAGSRRHEERVEILGEMPGSATVRQTVSVKELSLHGASVEITHALQLNSLHVFKFMLGDEAVVVSGRVAHIHIEDVDPDSIIYRAGIQFVDVPQRVSERIASFLEAVKAGRVGPDPIKRDG